MGCGLFETLVKHCWYTFDALPGHLRNSSETSLNTHLGHFQKTIESATAICCEHVQLKELVEAEHTLLRHS